MSGLHCLNGLAMDASKEQVRATDPQYRNDLVRHIRYGSRGPTWNERALLSNMIEIAAGMKVKATFNVETDLDIANEARELPNALHICISVATTRTRRAKRRLLQLFGSFARLYCCGDLAHHAHTKWQIPFSSNYITGAQDRPLIQNHITGPIQLSCLMASS
ncbi:hypothetical protein BDR06DRAFT_556179 [Suillus hirtellus]|nr:hypothetical protein BDR06DRAFT_556179 [Suillus hirtellus]